jgi:hypothetical protein
MALTSTHRPFTAFLFVLAILSMGTARAGLSCSNYAQGLPDSALVTPNKATLFARRLDLSFTIQPYPLGAWKGFVQVFVNEHLVAAVSDQVQNRKGMFFTVGELPVGRDSVRVVMLVSPMICQDILGRRS